MSSSKPEDGIPCPTCGRTFSSQARMERHARRAHGSVGMSRTRRQQLLVAGVVVLVVGIAIIALDAPGGGPTAREANLARLGVNASSWSSPHLGNTSAPVVVVAFETPACPSCRYFTQHALPDLNRTYMAQGKVVYFYRQYEIGYAFDEPGGVAQLCVAREDGSAAFWRFTDVLYRNQGQVNGGNVDGYLQRFADAHGYDAHALTSCYDRSATRPQLVHDLRSGHDNGVPGTPYFFVFGPTGKAHGVGAGELRQAIDDALQAASSSGGA